jgi:hypothetical protein
MAGAYRRRPHYTQHASGSSTTPGKDIKEPVPLPDKKPKGIIHRLKEVLLGK